jgi:hypothetical protein
VTDLEGSGVKGTHVIRAHGSELLHTMLLHVF